MVVPKGITMVVFISLMIIGINNSAPLANIKNHCKTINPNGKLLALCIIPCIIPVLAHPRIIARLGGSLSDPAGAAKRIWMGTKSLGLGC